MNVMITQQATDNSRSSRSSGINYLSGKLEVSENVLI